MEIQLQFPLPGMILHTLWGYSFDFVYMDLIQFNFLLCNAIDIRFGTQQFLVGHLTMIAEAIRGNIVYDVLGMLIDMLSASNIGSSHSYMVNGIASQSACNVLIVYLPTNEPVMGIHDIEIPSWNTLEPHMSESIFTIANGLLHDDGMVVCMGSMYSIFHLVQVCNGEGFWLDHMVQIACTTPIGYTHGLKVIK